MLTLSTLNILESNQEGKIIKINADKTTKRRLFDLGFSDGALVKMLYKSPYGNPIAYLVRGSVIALRNEIAALVIIDRNI